MFLTTDKHKPGYKRWGGEISYNLPTADTGRLISDLVAELKRLYSPRYAYHRGGVLLYDFVPAGTVQTDLLGDVSLQIHDRNTSRMVAVDTLNEKFGNRTVRYAAEDLGNVWKPKYNRRSPRYTTELAELPKVNILP